VLSSGIVLVVGGCNASSCNTVTATAELYDPNAGTWATTGSLSIARDFHTATLLSDGRVLVAGGHETSGTIAQAEVYHPATGKWSSAGNLNNARAQSTATLVPSGKVLVAGGLDPNGARLSSAELYNPATNSWALTGSLIDKRYDATATLLSSGKVLLAGGSGRPKRAATNLVTCELYDPATGTWSSTRGLHVGGTQNTVSMLQNGKILALGGIGAVRTWRALNCTHLRISCIAWAAALGRSPDFLEAEQVCAPLHAQASSIAVSCLLRSPMSLAMIHLPFAHHNVWQGTSESVLASGRAQRR
jgi:N-acetylneuraminic acid mutarotase